jgi:2-desacetyl-2-hydroxyethyl bacteriochlorophyllide A dehydrogenase
MVEARAYWAIAPGRGELRREILRRPGPDEVLVEASFSGISRGTERLVHRGRVPQSQWQAMRAPFQAGDFGFPVKYGYSSVGVVVDGSEVLRGRRVFCLHPHQDRYVVPADAVIALPDGLPEARAVLAANMETALNGLWDGAPRLGDRIAVVGAGVVGALAAALAVRVPGSRVELIDVDPRKAGVARAMEVDFRLPQEASGEADLVIHASGAADGLATALGLAGFEATVLELSWYGDQPVAAPLGEAFHSRRLVLRSSQVGMVAPARRGRRSHRERAGLALELLCEPRFDALLAPPVRFAQLPEAMSSLMAGQSDVMCQLVDYR